MADPVTLSTLAIGSMVATGAGAGVSAFGNLFSGKAQSNLYNYQAGIAQQNATLAKQDANYALATGGVEEEQAGMRSRAQIGATRAGFGASNVDVNTGSSGRVIASETEIGQENEGVVAANAAKRAYGFGTKAAMDTAQGNIYQTAASTSKTAGGIGALSSIVGGAGAVSSKWLQFGQSFGPGNSGGSSDYFGNTGGDSSDYYGG